MDVNRFKEINDTLGHEFGDQVLREVARRLRGALDGTHLVARLGGDEFMVMLRGLSCEAANVQAQALWTALKQPLDLPSTRVGVEGSFGMACYPQHGADADTLLRRADIALYDAKAAHGGVAVYQPGHLHYQDAPPSFAVTAVPNLSGLAMVKSSLMRSPSLTATITATSTPSR